MVVGAHKKKRNGKNQSNRIFFEVRYVTSSKNPSSSLEPTSERATMTIYL